MAGTAPKNTIKALDRVNQLRSHLTDIQPLPGRLTKLSRSLTGKKAIVTGAASGMGKETAKVLADEGVRVALLDLEQAKVDAVVDEINAVHPGRATGWVCDVADRTKIKSVCGEVIEKLGGLDVSLSAVFHSSCCFFPAASICWLIILLDRSVTLVWLMLGCLIMLAPDIVSGRPIMMLQTISGKVKRQTRLPGLETQPNIKGIELHMHKY